MPPDESKGETPSTPTPKPGETPADDGDDQDEAYDKPRAMATIRTLRQQADVAEKARKLAEKKAADLVTASMTEAEKTTARLAQLEAEKADWSIRERRTRATAEVTREAARAGASGDYIDAVSAVVTGGLDYDAEGNATNVALLVDEAKKKYPAMFGQPAQPRAPGRADAGPNSRTTPQKTDHFGTLLRGR